MNLSDIKKVLNTHTELLLLTNKDEDIVLSCQTKEEAQSVAMLLITIVSPHHITRTENDIIITSQTKAIIKEVFSKEEFEQACDFQKNITTENDVYTFLKNPKIIRYFSDDLGNFVHLFNTLKNVLEKDNNETIHEVMKDTFTDKRCNLYSFSCYLEGEIVKKYQPLFIQCVNNGGFFNNLQQYTWTHLCSALNAVAKEHKSNFIKNLKNAHAFKKLNEIFSLKIFSADLLSKKIDISTENLALLIMSLSDDAVLNNIQEYTWADFFSAMKAVGKENQSLLLKSLEASGFFKKMADIAKLTTYDEDFLTPETRAYLDTLLLSQVPTIVTPPSTNISTSQFVFFPSQPEETGNAMIEEDISFMAAMFETLDSLTRNFVVYEKRK